MSPLRRRASTLPRYHISCLPSGEARNRQATREKEKGEGLGEAKDTPAVSRLLIRDRAYGLSVDLWGYEEEGGYVSMFEAKDRAR